MINKMQIKGKAWKFGNNVNTDEIIPARYLNTSDPDELAKHCMEDIDSEFVKKIHAGDIIIAGDNFGCGSSREHAPIAIKSSKISCVIANSFARIFYRNSINIGLPILECPEAVAGTSTGNELEVNLGNGTICNLSTGKTYQAASFPPFMQSLIAAGGLMEYVRQKVR